MKKSNIITEGALFSGLYLLLLLMTVYLPVLGTISMFLLPIPFIIYTYKHGLKYSLVMFVSASILTIILATIFSLPVTLLTGIGGIGIGVALHAKRSIYETWAIGSVLFALGFVGVLLLSQVLFDVNFVDEMDQMIDSSINTAKVIFEQFGEVPEETISIFEEQMSQVTYLIPAMIGFVGIIYSFISMWVGFKVINRTEKETRFSFPPFHSFRLPTSLIWYYLASIVVMWVEPEQGSLLNQAAVNISMLIGFLLVLQGLSLIAYYSYIKSKSKGLLIAAIVLMVLFPFLFIYPIRILGIIDIGFNLRQNIMSNKK